MAKGGLINSATVPPNLRGTLDSLIDDKKPAIGHEWRLDEGELNGRLCLLIQKRVGTNWQTVLGLSSDGTVEYGTGANSTRLPYNELNQSANIVSWTDAAASALEGTGAAGLVQQDFPQNGAPFQAVCMVHNANDQLSFATQMPHAWDKGQVRPHIHVVPLADPAAPEIARFTMTYAWCQQGVAVPALASWTTVVATVTINPGDVLVEKIVNFGLIDPPANAEESDILMWVAIRTGTDVGDTYTTNKSWQTGAANLAVISFDVHYMVEKAGSYPEFIP